MKRDTCSERVLYGLCSLHHLLVAFANDYPVLGKAADEYIQAFIGGPHEWPFPPYVSLLLFLLLTKIPLQEVLPPLAEILLVWNSFHIAKKVATIFYKY